MEERAGEGGGGLDQERTKKRYFECGKGYGRTSDSRKQVEREGTAEDNDLASKPPISIFNASKSGARKATTTIHAHSHASIVGARKIAHAKQVIVQSTVRHLQSTTKTTIRRWTHVWSRSPSPSLATHEMPMSGDAQLRRNTHS